MTDPIYGDSPLDPGAWWDDTFPTPLAADPYWIAWRNVAVAMMTEFLESQWLMRWRRALVTAEGTHLRLRGEELGYAPQPAGWTDDRYRAVLVALTAGAYSIPTTEVAFNIATALLVAPQTFTFVEEFPSSARFTFTDTSEDDAISYIVALEYGRPRGSQFFLVAHPDLLTTFTIDSSTIDGPDTLGLMLTI